MSPSRGSRTPAGDALSELVVQVFRLNGLLAATGDSLAQPAGQTSARWRVLATVEHGPCTIAQIARNSGLPGRAFSAWPMCWWRKGTAATRRTQGIVERSSFGSCLGAGGAPHDPGGSTGVGGRRWGGIGEADLRRANAVLARAIRAVARQRPGP